MNDLEQLKNQLKTVEEDRDASKLLNLHLIIACNKVLESRSLKEAKEIVSNEIRAVMEVLKNLN